MSRVVWVDSVVGVGCDVWWLVLAGFWLLSGYVWFVILVVIIFHCFLFLGVCCER